MQTIAVLHWPTKSQLFKNYTALTRINPSLAVGFTKQLISVTVRLTLTQEQKVWTSFKSPSQDNHGT